VAIFNEKNEFIALIPQCKLMSAIMNKNLKLDSPAITAKVTDISYFDY